jgi:hypothetical protein
MATARWSLDPEPFFIILGRVRRPRGRWNLLAAARVGEVRRINAQRVQVACLRAAVTFDSGGGSASSAENCECTTDETLVIGCGSHLLARFRFLFDEQKMGAGQSYCNAQSGRPAMQRKQARSLFKPDGPADRPWEEALCRSGPKGVPDPIVLGLSLRWRRAAQGLRRGHGPEG